MIRALILSFLFAASANAWAPARPMRVVTTRTMGQPVGMLHAASPALAPRSFDRTQHNHGRRVHIQPRPHLTTQPIPHLPPSLALTTALDHHMQAAAHSPPPCTRTRLPYHQPRSRCYMTPRHTTHHQSTHTPTHTHARARAPIYLSTSPHAHARPPVRRPSAARPCTARDITELNLEHHPLYPRQADYRCILWSG